MIDGVIEIIQTGTRINIDRDLKVWYNDILDLAGKLEITEATPRMTSIQRNWPNIPSYHPIDQERLAVVFHIVTP